MAAERAINAIKALESLSNLMDGYDEFDEEEPLPKKRKVYVMSYNVENQLLKSITWTNNDVFCPLTLENFEDLYNKVASNINEHTLFMPSLSLKIRLAMTLRYLINGDSQRTLGSISNMSRKCTTKIVGQMMKYIIEILEKDYLKLPTSENEWNNIANDFINFWEFPNTLGALEAKHFQIKYYKTEISSRSLILLGILDAHSRFQYIEIIESNGNADCKAYLNSKFYNSLIKKSLNIPAPKALKGQITKTPYFFVGSDKFGMDRYTLKPYDPTSNLSRSQKAFNFRINRVKSPALMAFDLLIFKFKIFHRLKDIRLDNAILAIKASCILHNYFTQKLVKPLEYNENLLKLGLSCYGSIDIPDQEFKIYENAEKTRENICSYCVDEGNIPEQWKDIIKME